MNIQEKKFRLKQTNTINKDLLQQILYFIAVSKKYLDISGVHFKP